MVCLHCTPVLSQEGCVFVNKETCCASTHFRNSVQILYCTADQSPCAGVPTRPHGLCALCGLMHRNPADSDCSAPLRTIAVTVAFQLVGCWELSTHQELCIVAVLSVAVWCLSFCCPPHTFSDLWCIGCSTHRSLFPPGATPASRYWAGPPTGWTCNSPSSSRAEA